MRAGLPDREPKQVENWLKGKTYHAMVERQMQSDNQANEPVLRS